MQISTKKHWTSIFSILCSFGFMEMLYFDWMVTRTRSKILNFLFASGDGRHSCTVYGRTFIAEYCQYGFVRRLRLTPFSKKDFGKKMEWDFEYI